MHPCGLQFSDGKAPVVNFDVGVDHDPDFIQPARPKLIRHGECGVAGQRAGTEDMNMTPYRFDVSPWKGSWRGDTYRMWTLEVRAISACH
jgi:hypothetical protein